MSILTNTISVALIGNPNTGKSTLFTGLSGVRQQIGNYPGVTVEKKIGHFLAADRQVTLIDLPGTYSLAPRSPDEMIAVDVLLGRGDDVPTADVILCIVDASNLERNLYLVSQLMELERPLIIALNMTDVASARGMKVDTEELSRRLGVPVVATQANRRQGLSELKKVLSCVLDDDVRQPVSPFPAAFVEEVTRLRARFSEFTGGTLPRYLAERLLLDTSGYIQNALLLSEIESIDKEVASARTRLAESGILVPAVEAISRYQWVATILDGVVDRKAESSPGWSDRVDRILTHKLGGSLIFAALMVVVFQAVFSWAGPLMDWIELSMNSASSLISSVAAEGALRSLLIDGVIAGVGGVLVFLPQICILFFFIAVLEDCGYMARAAYLMDKLMTRIGLSGKSFIPLLSSFACAVPGIMAARVIENRRDRLVTILIAPLMSCSARLPVYTILIAAFIPAKSILGGWLGLQGLTMFAMYLVGMAVAVIVALLLKKTILPGKPPPFIMELPTYKVPSPRVVATRVWERGGAFVRRAGTLIFAVSVLVWAAAYYPRNEGAVEDRFQGRLAALEIEMSTAESGSEEFAVLQEQRNQIENEINGTYLRQSFLGRAGRVIEPVVKPLGWDWRLGCAALASFPAREVVIGTLGVIYNVGEADEESTTLRESLQQAKWDGTNRPVFSIPVALSVMVFFALCAQCASTLVIMKHETNSWRWPVFTFLYMTLLAYLGAMVTYQVGSYLLA